MAFGTLTEEFDSLQYLPAIQRMYAQNSVEEIKEYASFSQVERFRCELETLRKFGLHKELEIRLDGREEARPSGRKISDGKVDTIFSVSKAAVRETYRDSTNRKYYCRKIRNAFLDSAACKSNEPLSYDGNNPPHCLNCGGQLEMESETYFCPYCRSCYKAEAYNYLLTRFIIEGALRNLPYLFFLFLPALFLAILQVKGVIHEEQMETIAYIGGILLSFLLLCALGFGCYISFRHRKVLKNIRDHDPHFSGEIFTQRLNDLLVMYPEVLMPAQKSKGGSCGVICRNVLHLVFHDYERIDDVEIIECRGQADTLWLQGKPHHVCLWDKRKKFTVRLARVYGTLTPLHYLPDQFTCPHCGSHQMVEQVDKQVCAFCHTERPMESVDWVLYENRN